MSRAITIASSCATRIGSLVRLLGSDKDGEVLATAAALNRTLAAAGTDLHHLAHIVERGLAHHHAHHDADDCAPDYAVLVSRCWQGRSRLTPKEVDFICSMLRWQGAPSERQAAWLLAIADRLGVA